MAANAPCAMEALTDDFTEAAASLVGSNNVLTDPADCWAYGADNSRRHNIPQMVVFADHHEQVMGIVALCHKHHIPLVARGRGTGTAGAAVPVRGGVVLSLEHMNAILNVDADNRIMHVQPGVTNREVQIEAAKYGFFWPPDPTSADVCTVGGNLACNAAGPRAVKYGTTRDNVLGLRCVTGTGDEITTGVQTTKGVVGYDLTRLLIGSEGTLGIITEATLKLVPLPETITTLRVLYSDIQSATRAISRIMAQPVTPCALEFMDAGAIQLAREYGGLELPETARALLMIEVDGSAAAIDSAVKAVSDAARNDGLISLDQAETREMAEQLWASRKALSPALRHIAPKKINEDVVVPVSRIPDLLTGLEALAKEFGITIVNFGHAGNGNIHVNLLIDPDDPQQMGAASQCLDKMFSLVLDLQGTLSGEHGIGMEKREFVGRELEPYAIQLMRQIKQQFDPAGILNPDKLYPSSAER